MNNDKYCTSCGVAIGDHHKPKCAYYGVVELDETAYVAASPAAPAPEQTAQPLPDGWVIKRNPSAVEEYSVEAPGLASSIVSMYSDDANELLLAALARDLLSAAPLPARTHEQALPEGWKPVPVEATRGMIDAALEQDTEGEDDMLAAMSSIYSAMVAAAPLPVATQQDTPTAANAAGQSDQT